jgi:hypothetical protein
MLFTAFLMSFYRETGLNSERTENTAIAFLWLDHFLAGFTLMKK